MNKQSIHLFLIILFASLLLTACGQNTATTLPGTTASTSPSNPASDATQPTEPVHVHSWEEWKTVLEATCAAPGTKTRTCSCGETETESIAQIAHTEVVDPAVEPSCAQTGLTEGKHCSVCGEITVAQTSVPATGHSYQNGECACGALEHGGTLTYLEGLPLTSFIWSNGEIICGEIEEDCYYVYNVYGEYLAGPYDGLLCPNPDGYVIAWNRTWEIIDTVYDEDFGEYIDIEHSVTEAYLIDPQGNIIYESTAEWTDDVWTRTYEGEYLEYCNDDRIITVTWDTYIMPTMGNECTVHIRDMQGNLIADIENVREFSCMIDGKMIVYSWDYIAVVDKDGNVLAQIESLYEEYPDHYFWPESVGNSHHKVYFAEGYVSIDFSNVVLLFSENGENNYLLDPNYLYSLRNYGTLMFSKVYNAEGELSEHYYLIDIAKCATDDTGIVIPSLDAAVSTEPLLLGAFHNYFGTEEMYMVIETLDGKFGFMSRDGQIFKLYDDTTGFYGGYAMVQEGDEIYVIDENFHRVSEIFTGYDSVSASGEGVFILRKDDIPHVYIFTP